MPTASNAVTIERPPSEVFAFLADAENDKKWRPGVIEMTRTAGSGVGSTYHQMVQGPGGRPVAADIEIDGFEPDRLITFHTTMGPVRPSGRYEIAPSGAGSTVTFTLNAELHGPKRLMSSMVKKTMAAEVEALSRLKGVLEAGV